MAFFAQYKDSSGEDLDNAYWRIDEVVVRRATASQEAGVFYQMKAYRSKTKAQNREIDPIPGSLCSITRNDIIAAGVGFTEQELEDAIEDTGDGAVKLGYQKIKKLPEWSNASDA